MHTRGYVYGLVKLTAPMRCLYDYRRYPFDKVECRYRVIPHSPFTVFKSQPVDQFRKDLASASIQTPIDWTLEEVTEDKTVFQMRSEYTLNLNRQQPQISFRFTLKRRSQLAYKFAVILLATSVVLGMFSPLTGTLSGIKSTKLTSIAASVVGMAIFALRNPKLYHSKVVPRISEWLSTPRR